MKNNAVTAKDFLWVVPVLVEMLGGDVVITPENIAALGEGMSLIIHDTLGGTRFVWMPMAHATALAGVGDPQWVALQ